MSELLQCTGLTKRYGGKLALDHVELQLGEGKIVGLLGPNGSGKTTLMKLANGLLQPTEGSITIAGPTGCGWSSWWSCFRISTRILTPPRPTRCWPGWSWTPKRP